MMMVEMFLSKLRRKAWLSLEMVFSPSSHVLHPPTGNTSCRILSCDGAKDLASKGVFASIVISVILG